MRRARLPDLGTPDAAPPVFFSKARALQAQGVARLLNREEPEVGELLADLLNAEGIDLRLWREALRVERATDGIHLVSLNEDSGVRAASADSDWTHTAYRRPEPGSGRATITKRGVRMPSAALRLGRGTGSKEVGSSGRAGEGPPALSGSEPAPLEKSSRTR